jgi:hypothetical protein
MADSKKDPLFGFMPREVTAKQVRGAIVRAGFYSFSHRILDDLAGWQGKPVHSIAAF